MENYIVESEEYKGFKIVIEFDNDCESPRNWGLPSKMVFESGRQMPCGDENVDDLEERLLSLADYSDTVRESLEYDFDLNRVVTRIKKTHLIIPIDVYIHSGVTVRTTSFSSRMRDISGLIYISKEEAKKNWPKATLKQMYTYLEGEVETYDQFLTGMVYRQYVEEIETEEWVDSCSGYYHEPKEIIAECKIFVDTLLAGREQAAKLQAKLLSEILPEFI